VVTTVCTNPEENQSDWMTCIIDNREGGGGGDWGRGELLEPGLFRSGLESGFVSVLQDSGSNIDIRGVM